MSTKASASNLIQAVEILSHEWEEAKSHWHDVKSREFEKNYLDELPGHAARASVVMEEIDTLIRKVRSDCE